jgi:hypothetical protein
MKCREIGGLQEKAGLLALKLLGCEIQITWYNFHFPQCGSDLMSCCKFPLMAIIIILHYHTTTRGKMEILTTGSSHRK